MFNKLTKTFGLISLWCSLLIPAAHAEEPQNFAIELIIFEQLTSNTDEQWPETPYSTDIYDVIEPEILEVTLTDVAKKLRRPRYKVLYHQAWKQELLSKHSAKPVLIQNEDNTVRGLVKIYKETYYHAELDLWLNPLDNQLHNDPETITAVELSDTNPVPAITTYVDEEIEVPRSPHLKQSRRITGKKLNFFDHPRMGVLINITPIKEEKITDIEAELEEIMLLPAETEALPTTPVN